MNRLKSYAESLSIFAVDLATVYLLFMLSVTIRTEVLPLIYPGFPAEPPFSGLSTNALWIFAVWIFFFYYEGLYTKRFSFWDEVKTEWRAAFFATVAVFTIVSIGKLSDEVSRTVIILMGLLSLVVIPATRTTAKKLLRRLGLFNRRVLILGAGLTGKLILKALRRESNFGYQVVGFIDDDPAKIGSRIEGVKVHRNVSKTKNYLKSCNITDVFIAMPGARSELIQGLINELQHRVERVLYVPDMFGMAVVGTSLQHFFQEQAFAIELKNNLSQPLNVFIKRCFDFAVGGVLFALFALPMAVISIIIKLSSPGPAVFSQLRAGRKGKQFRCLKFRTMYEDADRRLREILSADPEAKEQWENSYKLTDDPRITPVGRFLRQTSLDELPQFINVIMGQMSLVGPRPVTDEELELYYKDRAKLCFSVPPGVTGLWQVSGRSNTSYEYRVSLDSWYVRNWNLWLDIVILLKTIRVVLYREGAF